MSWISQIVNAFRLGHTAADLDEELQFHLNQRVDDLVRAGMPRAEAQRLARRELGNPLRLRESSQDIKSFLCARI